VKHGQEGQLDTPVALFIFRRPAPTLEVFTAIREVRPRELFIVADGPRPNNPSEADLVAATRELVENIDWPCEVHRIYSDRNLGLRDRLLSGLDEVFSQVSEAIILEDDCLPNHSFFSFSAEILARFRDDTRVGIVSGFNFAPERKTENDYFFSRSTLIWGWATWARTWNAFRLSPQVEEWTPSEIKGLSTSFSNWFQRREFLGLLRNSKSLDTWDISLAVWIRQAGLLNVIPHHNFIRNIGFGSDATHTKFEAFDLESPQIEIRRELKHNNQVGLGAAHEKRMWNRKLLRWVTYPLTHPLRFVWRFIKFFGIK